MSLPTIILPWTERTLISLTGDDRANFLHNLCTADINRLQIGQGSEAFITNVQGKTIGHGMVGCREHGLWFATVPGQSSVLMAHFDKYLITEDVELRDETDAWDRLLISGPDSPAILKRTLCVDVADAVSNSSFQGKSLVLWRMPFTADESYSILWPNDDDSSETSESLSSALVAAGAKLADETEMERRRLLNGFPWFGVDVTDSNLPQEIDRNEQAISFTKGCYLGQETVARIDALGHVNQVLTRVESEQAFDPGTELFCEDKLAGRVTSSAPNGESHVGLAFVRRELAESQTVLALPSGQEIRQVPKPKSA